MRKTLILMVLLLATMQAAKAWEGEGTSSNPYLIQNSADWKQLCDNVKGGNSYSGKYFRMTTAIDAQGVSVGDESNPFSGTFDGDGNTLTYNRGTATSEGITFENDFCAPFVRIDGATICHLNVTGKIYSSHKHAAGIVCHIDGEGTPTIQDCHVSSLLWAGSELQSDATFAGLVGNVNSSCKADPVVKDCTFTGRITGHATRSSGLVGYTDRPITFENCIFDPEETPIAIECATLVRTAPGVKCTFEECYYTMKMGTDQGQCMFSEVLTPEGCKAEILSEPKMQRNGKKYYVSGAQVELTVPEGTAFNHWVTEGTPGCFINDPWTAGGIHTLSDVRSKPILSIATSMPEPVQSTRKRLGIDYRYISNRDYLLFMSDSLRQARDFQFDSDGECYVYDAEGTKNYVTVVWDCDPDAEAFKNYYHEGWFWKDKNYEGSIICNDLVASIWDHTMLFGIAPRAFQGVKSLKRIMFLSNEKITGKSDCTAPLVVNIQEQAFKDSGIEELVMVYRDEKNGVWVDLGPTSDVTIAPDAFDGTDCKICVVPTLYQQFLSNKAWSHFQSRISIYAAKVEDMKVEGAVYSYWRNNIGEPLKNDNAGHKSLMEILKYWNADYQQFNAATLLSNSDKNIWYTQVVGADDSYLKSNKGVMRIYNDPGSQYNYKTIGIQSLGGSKEVKEIEFYQTNGLSDNSYTEPKIVIQNNAFKGCDNLKELRLFYYVEDGEDRWTALGPKDVIPGNNIFGLKEYTMEDALEVEQGTKSIKGDPTMPDGFKILVSPELYPDYLEDPNWLPYLAYIEPVDYSPSAKSDITKHGLTYGFMTNPGGIMQTSQTVSQDVSWWTAPRIAIELALWAYTIYRLTTIPTHEGVMNALGARAELVQASGLADEKYASAVAQKTLFEKTMTNVTVWSSAALPKEGDVIAEQVAKEGMITALSKLHGKTVGDLFVTNATAIEYMTKLNIVQDEFFYLTENVLAEKSLQTLKLICGSFKTMLGNAISKQSLKISALETAKKAASKAIIAEQAKYARVLFNSLYGKLISGISGTAATAIGTAGVISSECWGGSGSYDGDQMQKGMRANILSNIHQVSLVGAGYVITTPSKNLLYHTFIKNVPESTTDAVIYAGFDDDNNTYTSDRTMTFAKKAFRDHKKLKTVSFHAMEGQSSNAAMPMLITIPDSAFVGCDNLVEFNLLLQDNEKGTRPLGPENFILAGDSIFAGLDSTKFHIVIDPSRKQDFLDNESWEPLKKYFTYRNAVPGAKYNVYGGQYAYSYENNSIKREHKVSGHLIEHTEVIGADNKFLDEHQGALKLCNDIGQFDNFQLDAVHPGAFKGNDHLRVVNFTDLYGAGAYGTSYTGLEMALGDSCFANCKNLADLDMLYLVTDGTNRIDPIKPEWVKVGNGILDGTNAIIKMMPKQKEWFMADSSWVAYKDRFSACIIKPSDEGVQKALKPMAYYDMSHTGNDWKTWDEYIDLARIAGAGFSWLDGKFRKQSDDLLSFSEFKYFENVGLDYVGKEWFRGCKKLSNIELPNTIKTIKEYAFASCFKLEEIELPASVTEIGNQAFDDCRSLRTIVVRGTTPAKLTGSNQFLKLDGLKIYVPSKSLNDYLTAWAEYKDYIVSDASYKINKVVTVKEAGTLADELGLYVEWSYSGGYAGDEPRYIHGNFSKYDSLTVSGPLNNLDLWVIRYLAGNNGYNRGGVATDGRLRYLNLYDASIVKDSLCKAHYLNSSVFINNLWREVDKDNVMPIQLFHGCTALENVILPKSLTTVTSGIFEGCTALKRLAMTGALKEYDGYGYKLYHMLDYPLEELVFLTDGHASSDAKDPWGQNLSTVYTTQARISDYLNDPVVISKTENVSAPFEDDDVWNKLIESGEFFPSVIMAKEDVGTIFSEQNKAKTLKTFDEFQYFTNVKRLEKTFAGDELLERVSIPYSVEHIAADAFQNCYKLKTITMKGDSVPELGADAFSSLPSDFVINVPRDVVKVYRTKWAQYADHINPESTLGGSDEILTVTLTEPNTLADKLGLNANWVPSLHMNKKLTALKGVRGDYSKITRLKVVGPISGGDLVLIRYLAGFCSWTNTRNFAGHLEYVDLYDAQLKASDYNVAPDVHTAREIYVGEDNVLPAYSLLQAYKLKTLILPRTLKEVRSRALQQCEGLETLVLGDNLEEFNWNALDDNASLTRMYILANKKVDISTEFAVWRWLCNNYNPTFDAFYVRPSLYQDYLMDDKYTGQSWQRTNNISTGAFTDDDSFAAFASHATATEDELATVTSVEGWFDTHPGVKDLTALEYTAIDSLSKATLAPLTQLEKASLPLTLGYLEDGLFEKAKKLRYVDFLFCDSTDVVAGLRDGGFKRLGINTDQTLVYVPQTYGESDGANIVTGTKDGKLIAKAFHMADTLNYMVPYPFETSKIENTRPLPVSSTPYTMCVPYKLKVPTYSRAYTLSDRNGNALVFKEVTGELEAMQPYLLKVTGNKRLRKTSTTLNTEIKQTIPASDVNTYGRQVDATGYSMRGTFEGIDNATATELGAYILQSNGNWYPVSNATEEYKKAVILPFRAYLLPSARNANPSIPMELENTDGIDTIETIDADGTEHYYDLQGRELPGKPERGIYIHNGKKVVVK